MEGALVTRAEARQRRYRARRHRTVALLAMIMRRGITVAGHADAITRLLGFLDQWQSGGGRRAWWPEIATRDQQLPVGARSNRPGRPSWCYETLGVARAQQLAGIALADQPSHKSMPIGPVPPTRTALTVPSSTNQRVAWRSHRSVSRSRQLDVLEGALLTRVGVG